jgi:cell division initiation protein
MEVTSRALREVEFREKLRGYNQDDVDEFLERVAEGVDALHERLRQALERAARAEQAAKAAAASAQESSSSEPGVDDDTLRRTLILAQRTADMAVKEANEKAEEILANAQNEARQLVADAQESARRMSQESARELKAEMTRLEEMRDRLAADVEALRQHVQSQRAQVAQALSGALKWLEENLPAPGPGPVLRSAGPSFGSSNEPGRDPLEAGLEAEELGSHSLRTRT